MYNNETFTCAKYWSDEGDNLPIDACNDSEECGNYVVRDGDDETTSSDDLAYALGSIIVKPGCHFYAYANAPFHNHVVTYENLENNGYLEPNIRVGPSMNESLLQCAPHG